MQSWRSGTTKQYNVYLKKWISYCKTFAIKQFKPKLCHVVEFLSKLYDSGIGYSAINTARSALSAGIQLEDSVMTLGHHPLVNRFMKGVFNSRPSLPRYNSIWNVETVLNYFRTLPSVDQIPLLLLSQKLVTLCLLVTGRRCQDIYSMHLDNMSVGLTSYKFKITNIVKTSKPGKKQPELTLVAFPSDKSLCVVTCLKEYLDRTSNLRNSRSLFVSCLKPHEAVSLSTLSRWAKTTLHNAGIDTDKFKTHSTRAASTSAAKSLNIPIDHIIKSAGWTQSGTFSKFYDKPIEQDVTENYGFSILAGANQTESAN